MNEYLRNEVERLKTEKGITYRFMVNQLGWGLSTFHNWRYSQYELSNEKLMELKIFVDKYKED